MDNVKYRFKFIFTDGMYMWSIVVFMLVECYILPCLILILVRECVKYWIKFIFNK